VIPLLLDLFLWFGPRLSAQAPIEALVDWAAAQSEGTPDTANQLVLDTMRQAAAQADLFGLLATQIPSMILLLDPAQTPLAANRPIIMLTSIPATIVVSLILVLIGLLLSIVYLTPIAQTVRAGAPDLAAASQRVWFYWLRVVALILIIFVAAIAVTVPLSIIAALLTVVGVNLLPLFLFVMQLAAIWLLFYLFFVVDAILVSEVGPLRAMRYSVAVVRHNFWSTLGLIVLTLLIARGLPIVFTVLARVIVGVPIAIVANAYISTGLAAASMIFYRDRLARWQQQQRAAALNRVGPGAAR
jgi:hypothetical protein